MTRIPDIALPATSGALVNLSRLQGLSVVFCYPYTGRPGYADPPGWDDVPGAHGSTPQAMRYGELCPRFEALGAQVFGLSLQSILWQSEFRQRMKLPFALLSDEGRQMTQTLGLETFRAGDADYLERVSFISRDGIILERRQVTGAPQNDADHALNTLEQLFR